MEQQERASLCKKHDRKNPRSWRACYSYMFEKYSKEMSTWIAVLYDRKFLESTTNSKPNGNRTN